MNPRTLNLLQLNVAVLMWGGTAMFAKMIALPVEQIICLRSLIAAGGLAVFVRLRGHSFRVKSGSHYAIMLTLGLLLCFHWLTYFQALKTSTAAVALLGLHTYPVITALIEPLLFREKLHRADVFLAGGVLAGVLVITPTFDLSDATTQGVLLGIVSGLFFMSRNLMTRKFVRHYAGSTLMLWQTAITGAVLLPFLGRGDAGSFSMETSGLLILLGIVFTAVPHTLFSTSFKNLSTKSVAVISTLLPLYGAVFGFFVHKEMVTPRTVLGGLIILACVAIETTRTASRTGKSDPVASVS